MNPLRLAICRASAAVIALASVCGCSGVAAANKCNADLGTTWAGNACISAVQDPSNQAIVKALADKACARARVGTSNAGVAQASCEEARAKVEKAAWIQIEKGAKSGQQPDLNLDNLMPGLPAEPAAPVSLMPAPPAAPSAPEPIASSPNPSNAPNVLIVNPAAESSPLPAKSLHKSSSAQ